MSSKRLTEHSLQHDGIPEPKRNLQHDIRILWDNSSGYFFFRTILNQSLVGLEFSLMVAINIVAMKGKIPNVRLMNLYFPITCIDHLRTGR
jgi:hypothetical protein